MPIDDEVFGPLTAFLVDDQFSVEELAEKYIAYAANARYGTEPGELRGIILESYVKWALERFAQGRGDFRQAPPHPGTLPYGRSYETDPNGTLRFYGPPRPDKTGRTSLNEIDALYEFNEQPVVFEITYSRRAKHIEAKKDLVRELYNGIEPYSCKIKPQRAEGPVQRRRPYNRSIIIPRHDAEFTRAMNLATRR